MMVRAKRRAARPCGRVGVLGPWPLGVGGDVAGGRGPRGRVVWTKRNRGLESRREITAGPGKKKKLATGAKLRKADDGRLGG